MALPDHFCFISVCLALISAIMDFWVHLTPNDIYHVLLFLAELLDCLKRSNSNIVVIWVNNLKLCSIFL